MRIPLMEQPGKENIQNNKQKTDKNTTIDNDILESNSSPSKKIQINIPRRLSLEEEQTFKKLRTDDADNENQEERDTSFTNEAICNQKKITTKTALRKNENRTVTSHSSDLIYNANTDNLDLQESNEPKTELFLIPNKFQSLSEVTSYLKMAMNTFDAQSRDYMVKIFRDFEIDENEPEEQLNFLKAIQQLTFTSYFHFVKEYLKTILVKFLNSNCQVPKELKLLSFEILLTHFDSKLTFQTLITLYSSIDTFRISSSSFRNYCLLKCLSNILKSDLSDPKQKSVDLRLETTFDCIRSFENCIPFVEYLTRNTENTICRYFLVLISYEFLRSINIDLLSTKLHNIPKDLNDNTISRIFASFSELKNSFEKSKSHVFRKENINENTIAKISHVEFNTNIPQNEYDSKARNNEVMDKNLVVENRNLDRDLIEQLENLIQKLFDFPSTKTILLSIYKRLFFYFLFKNKRLLQSGKVYRVFNKKEIRSIYKQIKNARSSFINVFKQIDQNYLIKEALKSDFVNIQLIQSINQETLNITNLEIFYSLCFSFTEKTMERLELKVFNPAVFFRQFNLKLDKSFHKYLDLTFSSVDLSSTETLNYLLFYSTNFSKFDKLVSLVSLVSLIVDDYSSLFIKGKVQSNNLILRILFNSVSYLNIPLVKRIVPVLRKLILYDEYVLNAGRLYFSIYKYFKLVDSIFTTDVFSSISKKLNVVDSFLPLKAAINHCNFKEMFKSAIQNDKDDTKNEDIQQYDSLLRENVDDSISHSVESSSRHQSNFKATDIISKSLIFYLYHNPEFSFEYQDLLITTLTNKNNNSLVLLEYLKNNVGCSSFFISENIHIFYDLFFHFDFSNTGEIKFPFQNDISEIFLDSLKMKIILPCMAIPYILPQYDCNYLYKNHLESCINCINDCLYIVSRIIREVLKKLTTDESDNGQNIGMNNHPDDNFSNFGNLQDENDQHTDNSYGLEDTTPAVRNIQGTENRNDTLNKLESAQFESNRSNKVVNKRIFENIFSSQISNNFFHSLSLKFSLKKILDKIDYQDDILIVFIILRQLKKFNKKEKQMVISHIQENCSDEKILDLIEKAKEFFDKNSRNNLPVDFIS